MSEKKNVPTLYFFGLKHFVQQMDLTVTSLNKLSHLRLLPPAILSDIYREVSLAEKDYRKKVVPGCVCLFPSTIQPRSNTSPHHELLAT
jgi:hypothetical protein